MAEVIQLSSLPKVSNFQQSYFDFADKNHFWCQWRFEIFKKLILSIDISTTKPLRILEIGCGNGIVRDQIESYTSWITDGTDLEISALQKNPQLRGKTYLYDISEKQKEFESLFDGIVLFDVLEHIQNTSDFISQIDFHLKPGGWLFVNVPAGEYLRGAYDDVQGHLRRYNKILFRQEFKNSNFQVRKLTYWGMSLIPLVLLRKILLGIKEDKEEIYRLGFQPPAEWFNSCMKFLMKTETMILSNPLCGTSLMSIIQKNG